VETEIGGKKRRQCVCKLCPWVRPPKRLLYLLMQLLEPKSVLLIRLLLYAATSRPTTQWVDCYLFRLWSNSISGKVSQLGKVCQFHIETARWYQEAQGGWRTSNSDTWPGPCGEEVVSPCRPLLQQVIPSSICWVARCHWPGEHFGFILSYSHFYPLHTLFCSPYKLFNTRNFRK
jgi:hypothetical protein